MCGICGAFGPEDKKLLHSMMDVMRHRGPDDEGTYIDDNVMLANLRLAIIDVKGGRQPIFNEDGSIVIVYNGETYNFPEMREDLEKRGHRFTTNSDTEVVLHAYEEYGPEFISLLNGMFAFAIYDSPKKTLMLGRDRFGINPLYYARVEGALFFSSDIKSILVHPSFVRKADPVGMHQFINLRYIPENRTIFSGVHRFPPAHYALITKGKMEQHRYWELGQEVSDISEEQAAKHVREVLERSVKRHLISDIPVGIFLSGGVDSSTVLSLASRVSDEPLHTFSMGFGEPDDELNDARIVAEHFETVHKEFILEKTVLKDFPEIIWYMGTPKRNVYPYYIYKKAANHVKVALGGLGGDELFGGYSFRYEYLDDVMRKRKQFGNDGMRMAAEEARRAIEIHLKSMPVEEDWMLEESRRSTHIDDDVWSYTMVTSADRAYELNYLKKRLYGDTLNREKLKEIDSVFRRAFSGSKDLIDKCLRSDFLIKMSDDFLVVDDGTSMANSLEIRTPFLDNEIVDLAFSLPASYKIQGGKGKIILKKAMKGLLPDDVFKKKKQGFATNTLSVYSNELKDMAKAYLSDGSLIREEYIQKNYVERILRAETDKKRMPQYNMLWNLLALEFWHRIFIDSENITSPPNIS
ncbi:MAG: asparagine synthase (glutamine-hydrolyzing) [Candidatus Micrarchaeota archaeon]